MGGVSRCDTVCLVVTSVSSRVPRSLVIAELQCCDPDVAGSMRLTHCDSYKVAVESSGGSLLFQRFLAPAFPQTTRLLLGQDPARIELTRAQDRTGLPRATSHPPAPVQLLIIPDANVVGRLPVNSFSCHKLSCLGTVSTYGTARDALELWAGNHNQPESVL